MVRLKLFNINYCSFVFFICYCSLLVNFTQQNAYYSDSSNDCPNRCHCSKNEVNCANQSFHFIPPLPSWTEFLSINDNPLEVLSIQSSSPSISLMQLSSPNNLVSIDFSRTQLRFIDADIFNTLFTDAQAIQLSLQNLNFNENQLITFPILNNITNLRTIILSNNHLNYDSITGIDLYLTYPNLRIIDLSFNSFNKIPKHFLSSSSHHNPSLTHLYLNNNEIEIIEDNAFELFTNLKVLKLSKNNIAIVSKLWFGQNINLRELDLNFNQINKIDILAFKYMDNLQVLKMRRNKLEHLSDGSFWGLSKLKKLQLDHNNIDVISQGWTYGLDSLKELSLKYNSITNISDNSWSSAKKLIEINLSFNKLQTIKKHSFQNLHSLKILRLSNNEISNVDKHSLRYLKNLESLDFSGNKLSWTIENSDEFFVGLNHLQELRLDENEIRRINKNTFNGLGNLKKLNLSSNPISSIQADSFNWFEALTEFSLENVDLLCDCTLKWFSKWLQMNRKFARKIQCKHPHELAIRTSNSFLDVDSSEFKCQDFLKPYLIKDFENISKPIAAIKNQEIRFKCNVASSSNDPIVFKWFKDDQIINHARAKMYTNVHPYSDNVTHYENILHLVNIQDEDQGKYHCMASNNFGSVYTQQFSVNVYIAPYFTKKPHNITVMVGQTAKLECAAFGQPSPKVFWQKDGGNGFPAAMERRMRMMPSDDVYFIVEVKSTDMGSYICNATNDAGSIASIAHLTVIQMPTFARKMTDKQAVIDTTVSLDCMASGIPAPVITWYKDGLPLQKNDRHIFILQNQRLIIVELKYEDRGIYSCNISNIYGTVKDSLYLDIISHNSSKKYDNFLMAFMTMIREHAIMVIIIVLCVVFTSIAWILVIFYIRQRSEKYFKNTETYIEYDSNSNSLDNSSNPVCI